MKQALNKSNMGLRHVVSLTIYPRVGLRVSPEITKQLSYDLILTNKRRHPMNTVTIKDICKKHNLSPRLSRMLLREAVKDEKSYPNLAKQHKPRTPWIWPKGSKALEEALNVLKPKK